MNGLLVKIDKVNLFAIEELQKVGKVKRVSLLLNLFSVECDVNLIDDIKKIKGVLSVEEDYVGSVMVV